jgi:hypothetical protein
MTADDFRKIALGFPDAIESSHMRHPDFRAGGKIFATLGYPDPAWGMVKLIPEQQRAFLQKSPAVFKPAAGAWGKAGSTHVRLDAATVPTARSALELAWQNAITSKAKKRPS